MPSSRVAGLRGVADTCGRVRGSGFDSHRLPRLASRARRRFSGRAGHRSGVSGCPCRSRAGEPTMSPPTAENACGSGSRMMPVDRAGLDVVRAGRHVEDDLAVGVEVASANLAAIRCTQMPISASTTGRGAQLSARRDLLDRTHRTGDQVDRDRVAGASVPLDGRTATSSPVSPTSVIVPSRADVVVSTCGGRCSRPGNRPADRDHDVEAVVGLGRLVPRRLADEVGAQRDHLRRTESEAKTRAAAWAAEVTSPRWRRRV